MVKIYADLIIKGLKTFNNVPESLKEKVLEELEARERIEF